jgi:DNA polymerase III subunit gamma/tau
MALALYRRYRPDTFEGVIGQPQVTVPLSRALDHGKLTHAYLFSGPRGCGKTSSARIFARCINCAQGPTSHPCGVCDSCRDLGTGGPGSIDVVEIDAASHNGVDDARELRERAGFAPVRDRYKIFILDEAHMVTQQGFNALLKIVEEPPEHVLFMFATTEPDKVISTIRSRTHHYPFRLVPSEVMEPYLEEICQKEKIEAEPRVLRLAIRAGGGSVRDTLSVLDQLMVGADQGEIMYDSAVSLLGYTPEALISKAIDAVIDQDGSELYAVIQKVIVGGFEPKRFVEDLLQRVRDLLVLLLAGQSAENSLSEDSEAQNINDLQSQSQSLGLPRLTQMADIIDETLSSMSGAISPRMRLELLAARLLVPPSELTPHVSTQFSGSEAAGAIKESAASPYADKAAPQTGFIGSRQAGGQAPAKSKVMNAQSQSVPSQTEQQSVGHEKMTLDQRWDAVVAGLPEGVQEYVVRQKVPAVALDTNAKGRSVLSMTFDQPMSQHAFALAVVSQEVDGEITVPKIVMARARQEFGSDTMIAPSGVAANGEPVESVAKMSPERRSEVKKQIALAHSNMTAMNLGFSGDAHTTSVIGNASSNNGQSQGHSKQRGAAGATKSSSEDGVISDSDDHHPAARATSNEGRPIDNAAQSTAAGHDYAESYVQPNELDDDDPWDHPQVVDSKSEHPERRIEHTREEQKSGDTDAVSKSGKMGLPDLSDQDDPWAQSNVQVTSASQGDSSPTLRADAETNQEVISDNNRESNRGKLNEANSAPEESRAQSSKAVRQETQLNKPGSGEEGNEQEKPEVSAEEDSYSLDDAQQGSGSLLGPQELTQFFDVKQVENLAADDPRNPLNANKRKRQQGSVTNGSSL